MDVRCSLFDIIIALEDALDPTRVRLKLVHACDQWHSSRESTDLTVAIINHVDTLKDERPGGCGRTVRVFRQNFTLDDAIGSHACSLEALPCVWLMAFLSGAHSSYQFTL
jgi:hypothetical protein